MKLRTLFIFAVSAVFVFCQYACANETRSDADNEQVTSSDVEFDPETDYDNRFGRGFSNVIETSDAYYWMNRSGQGSFIYYYDKNTNERDVFCNKPECTHDRNGANRNCDGFFSGISSINFYKGKIYYDNYIKTEDGWRTALFRVDPDGSNRELWMYLDHDESFAGQRFDIHRGKLYCWSYETTVKDAETFMTSRVLCWDIENKTGPICIMSRTKDTTIVPSIFYYGSYVYILNSWYNRITDTSVYEILRWNTENENLETMMLKETEGNKGSADSIWVEDEEHVYFSVSSDNPELTNVYVINGREPEIIISFGVRGGIRLVDGAAVCFYPNEDNTSTDIKISSYDAETVFEGSWPTDYLKEIAGCKEIPTVFRGFGAIMGDSHDLFIVYSLQREQDGEFIECLIRYSINAHGEEYQLLGKTYWK